MRVCFLVMRCFISKNKYKREIFSEESRETKLLVKGRQVGGPQGGTKMAISERGEAIELFKIAILFQHLDKFIFCAISHLFVARFPPKASGLGNLANLFAAPECFLCIYLFNAFVPTPDLTRPCCPPSARLRGPSEKPNFCNMINTLCFKLCFQKYIVFFSKK